MTSLKYIANLTPNPSPKEMGFGHPSPSGKGWGRGFGIFVFVLFLLPPAFIFATGVSTTLAIKNDSGSLIHYSVSYIKESA